MITKVYGDEWFTINITGNISAECTPTDYSDDSVLLAFSDGTFLKIWYDSEGIWRIEPLVVGSLFNSVDYWDEVDSSERCSDYAFFNDGITWCFYAKQWHKIEGNNV